MTSAPHIRRIILVSVLGLIPTLSLAGCGWYSFSGASIPDHLETIAIPLVQDNSVSRIGTLDAQMTELLINRFVRQTRLSLSTRPENANAALVVTITRYQNLPTSVSGNEQATRNRVTITATARYTDNVEDRSMLDRSFSAYEEYDPLNPAEEEVAALATMGKLVDDIFTASTSNW
jgi:Lipopolysaccharide-assembly